MAARECPAPTNKPNKKTKMKNLLLAAASLSLFCGFATPNAAQARDIASRAEYDRVTKNALDDIERKQIQPTVYNWGGGDVDGPDPGQVVFLRKRWPGEAAPDLFK
jgi:hypothetical protein